MPFSSRHQHLLFNCKNAASENVSAVCKNKNKSKILTYLAAIQAHPPSVTMPPALLTWPRASEIPVGPESLQCWPALQWSFISAFHLKIQNKKRTRRLDLISTVAMTLPAWGEGFDDCARAQSTESINSTSQINSPEHQRAVMLPPPSFN